MNIKECMNYDEIKNTIRPFDLIFFKGKGFISDIINFFEVRTLKPKEAKYKIKDKDLFTHVGLIITTEMATYPNMEDGKLYILESTISNNSKTNINDINGKSYLGVQIRDFEKLISVNKKSKTNVAVGYLNNNPLDNKIDGLKEKFNIILNKYIYTPYEFNPLALPGALINEFRWERNFIESTFKIKSDDCLFCSELVATVYKEINIFDEKVIPKNVVPMDFLGYDVDEIEDGGVPCVIKTPIVYIIY